MALRAFVRPVRFVFSKEFRFFTNLGSSFFFIESPTTFLGFLSLIGPRLTMSGSFALPLESLRATWLSERVTPDTIRGETAVATDF